jgi:threonine aldolase
MSLKPVEKQQETWSINLNPAHSETSVVFRGDGEPKSPRILMEQLENAQSLMESDNFSLGGTVAKLEERFAEMLGKQAAIFMPTGTLANHLAIRTLCGTKPRAIVLEQSHLYHDTGDTLAQLSGINLVPMAKGRTYFTLDELKEAIVESKSGRVLNLIGAVMIESPVRRQMGQITPFDEMKAITGFCRENGIGTHLDGARLFMMSGATGISPKDYSAMFDTVYVSLYKYFGAPFGAILAGDADFIDGMYHTRRMFGGGLASSYMVAALALNGSEGFEERFGKAMSKGRELVGKLKTLPNIEISEFEHGSNIFPFAINPNVDANKVVERLRERDVFIYPGEGSDVITSLTVNTTILRQSNDALFNAFREAIAD